MYCLQYRTWCFFPLTRHICSLLLLHHHSFLLNMKSTTMEFSSNLSSSKNGVLLPILAVFLLCTISLYAYDNFYSSLSESLEIVTKTTPLYPENNTSSPPPPPPPPPESSEISTSLYPENSSNGECNMFKGDWVRSTKGLYYTNKTKCFIEERQNCMNFGRSEEYLKWRWKPHECELPLFDAVQFLELVRGKTMAFVGDSVARNHMESLVCLLASTAEPIDTSTTPDGRFRRWLYTEYNFTVQVIMTPFLVKTEKIDPTSILMNLYLDEADPTWASQIGKFDIIVISAGQWFFRPSVYYENSQIIGCYLCNKTSSKNLNMYGAYQMAFNTAFKTIRRNKNFKGMTILRSFSPSHFEHGDFKNGGHCGRTRPYTKEELVFDWCTTELNKIQVNELIGAERRGKSRGLKFRLLDTTEAMQLRPDGHPNYGVNRRNGNKTIADCVHWCLPGPVDTWNEFLLQLLK